MTAAAPAKTRTPNLVALSLYWFALEAHWAALLGAATIGQIARFADPSFVGRASSILLGTGALFAIASQYVAGRASDRASRRLPFIIAGTICDIAALFAFAIAPSFLTVVVAFVAVQIALNTANGPYQALLPDLIQPSRQGKASAVMGIFRLSGNAAGLLLARFLVHQPGPGVSTAVFQHGLVMLAGAISVLLIAGLLTTISFVAEKPVAAPAQKEVPEKTFRFWPYRSSFIVLIVSRLLVSLGLYSILPFFAFFLKNSLHVVAYLSTNVDLLLTMTLCSLIGTLPAGIASDRLSKKKLMCGAIAALTIGAVGLAIAPSLSVVIAVAIPLGIGWGAYYSVDWALACNLLPVDRAGALMAVWNIGAAGPQVLAPLIGGYLVDTVGAGTGDLGFAFRALFALVAVYLVLGMGALAFVREPLRDAAGRNGHSAPIRLARTSVVWEKETVNVKKVAALIAVLVASGVAATACGSNSNSSSTTSDSSPAAATMAPVQHMAIDTGPPATKSSLPIPLAKLPSMKVAAGSVANGAKLFAANCESCHGAGGKNGQVGPTLYDAGLKAGQVAFMVRNPAAVDKDSSMPKLTITDKELADIAAYVASLK